MRARSLLRKIRLMGFLDGYRVIDLSDARGLLAGRLLADLGADVVQVEPVGGSTARSQAPHFGSASLYWDTYAANKRGAVYDPHSSSGRGFLADLVAAADVVIESSGPEAAEQLGLDRHETLKRHPALVWCSISPFGLDGPKASYADSDLIVWAAGGPLEPNRDGDRAPLRISVPQAYLHASADAAAGVLFALAAREWSGTGQLVDVSAQESVSLATLARVLAAAWDGEETPAASKGPDLSGSGSAQRRNKWQGRDGLIELNMAIGPTAGRFTNTLFAWMREEGVDVGRFGDYDWATVHLRLAAGEVTDADLEEARALIAGFLAERTKLELTQAATDRKVLPVGVFDMSDIAVSPQLEARDFWVTLGEGDRERTMPGAFAAIDRPAFEHRCPAPLLGEHTDEVAAQWLATPPPRAPSEPSRPPRPPMEGLKVLDLSWVMAGPVIGRALADFGATVVRVESSRRIEGARLIPPFLGATLDPEASALYETCNAGKLGMCIDLTRPEGQAVVRDLSRWADVLVESFSPGTMARWGLDQQTLRADNPGLIVLSTALCGQSGPWSSLAGFGNVGAALSGFQHLVGWPDRDPIGPYGPYTDYLGPRLSLVALLGALDQRRRSGEGCLVDVSQVEAGVWMIAPEMADWFASGAIAERAGNADRQFAPHGVYRCRPLDDRPDAWVAIAIRHDDDWIQLTQAMGRGDLAEDPRYATTRDRHRAGDELDSVIDAWTSTFTAPEVECMLQALDIPSHVVATSTDFCLDPQIAHRGYLVTVPHPRHGSVTVEGPRYQLSATPGLVSSAAPLFHQHRDHILGTILRYSPAQIAALDEMGVLV